MRTNKRIAEKKKESRRSSAHAKMISWSLLVFLSLILFQVSVKYAEPRCLPIKHIRIEASCHHINLSALQACIKPDVKGFFTTNMIQLKHHILKVPFVDYVTIKRIWPDTLIVSVKEIELVAKWGENSWLSAEGKLVTNNQDIKANLPYFVGPESQAKKMLEVYQDLASILQPYQSSIREIHLTSHYSWLIKLDNEVNILLGRQEIVEHFSSFASIYPQLKKKHGNEIATIDLRHSNGLAVTLKGKDKEEGGLAF